MENLAKRLPLYFFLIAIAVLLLANFHMMAPYLLAVLMGCILSLLWRPAYVKLTGRRIGPRSAAVMLTLAAGIIVVVPVIFFSIQAVNQAIEIGRQISDRPDFSFERISRAVAAWKPLRTIVGDEAAIQAQLKEAVKKVAGVAPGVAVKIVSSTPEIVLQIFLCLISCYFFLLDGGKFLLWLRDKIPFDSEVRASLLDSFKDTAASTTAATVTAATVQTIIVTTGFLLLGVPAAFLAGGLTFVMAWVPIVGSSPVWLLASLYLFTQVSVGHGIAMLGVGTLTGVSDNIVYPWILKGRAAMHPLVSLVSIFGGLQLFGIFGVFFGPILTALLIAMLESWPLIAMKHGLTFKAIVPISSPLASRMVSSNVEEKPAVPLAVAKGN